MLIIIIIVVVVVVVVKVRARTGRLVVGMDPLPELVQSERCAVAESHAERALLQGDAYNIMVSIMTCTRIYNTTYNRIHRNIIMKQ